MANNDKPIKLKKILKHDKIFNVIYVIFSETQPIYVGMSNKQCVQARLLNHLLNYFSRSPASNLSKFLYSYKKDYFEFTIQIFKIDAISRLIGNKQHCLKCAERNIFDFYSKKKGYKLQGNARAPYFCSNT